jgi:DNA modification methylase
MRHIVKIGDALDQTMMLDDDSVDAFIMDPPYASGAFVAAALTGRRAIGFERSPDFAQVAINRLAEEAGTASNGVPTVAMQPQMFVGEE